MDLSDALIRSMAAIDKSRNRRQATVLLNYRWRKLLAQSRFSKKQNQRTLAEMREACEKVVSSSFTVLARTGALLQRWDSALAPNEEIELPVQGSQTQPNGDSAPRQRYEVQKAG